MNVQRLLEAVALIPCTVGMSGFCHEKTPVLLIRAAEAIFRHKSRGIETVRIGVYPRAVAFFSGADLTNSCPTTLTKPIAYYASQASEDSGGMPATSPITGDKKQAQFAAVNGCMPEPSSDVPSQRTAAHLHEQQGLLRRGRRMFFC